MNRIRTRSLLVTSQGEKIDPESVPAWLWSYVAPTLLNLPIDLRHISTQPLRRDGGRVGVVLTFLAEGQTGVYLLDLCTTRQGELDIVIKRSQVELTRWTWQLHEHQAQGAAYMSNLLSYELSTLSVEGIL